MVASSEEERKALLKSLPYRTVAQRKALMKLAITGLDEPVEVDTDLGFLRPSALLLWILDESRGPRTSRAQAIERLAKKSLSYGARGGQLGAVMLYWWRRKKFVRWVPPGWSHSRKNWLTLERLMEALAKHSSGQTAPAWLYPFEYEYLEDFRDLAGALKILTGPR